MKLRKRLDDARTELIMSVADLYFKPDPEQDEQILQELKEQYPEEGEAIMELMPAWKRWGYDEGKEEGREEGQAEVIRKLLRNGFSPEAVAKAVEMPLDKIKKLQ